jgi:hypothetical protein
MKGEDSSCRTGDFKSAFQSAFDLYLVFAADLKIIAVCGVYLLSTKTKRNEVRHRGICKVSPDNPEYPATTVVRNLRASPARILQCRVSHIMAGQMHDIRKPEMGGRVLRKKTGAPSTLQSWGLRENSNILFTV